MTRPILTDDEKTAILICTCGCEGCLDFVWRMEFLNNKIIWSDFEQVQREWDYSKLGTFDIGRKRDDETFHYRTDIDFVL